jgi:hypothetical protein
MGSLTTLRLSENRLTNLTLPAGMTNLQFLTLSSNLLVNIVLPPDLNRLVFLNLGGNRLASFSPPPGLDNLKQFYLTGNQLTNITLPPEMTDLTDFGFLGNPLTTFVVCELLATNLAETIASMRNQGISVYTYPLTVQLARPKPLIGAFQFEILGPPGLYTIMESSDFVSWSALGTVTNSLGGNSFVDVNAGISSQKFYRAMR